MIEHVYTKQYFLRLRGLCIFLVLAFYCCEKDQNRDHSHIQKNQTEVNFITLIFNNEPIPNRYKKMPTKAYNAFSIVYFAGFDYISYKPKFYQLPDTIRIPCDDKKMFIHINDADGIPDSHFIFYRGDTIIFTFDKNNTIGGTLISDRVSRPYDSNYQQFERAHFVNDSICGKFDRFIFELFLTRNDPLGYKKFSENEHQLYLQKNKLLDSIRNKGLISDDIYAMHKNRLLYNLAKISEIDYVNHFFKTTNIQVDNNLNLVDLIPFEPYQSFLTSHVIKKLGGGKRVKMGRHSRPHDYRFIFDNIAKDTSIAESKTFLLFWCIRMIREELTTQDFDKYYAKFKKIISDTTYVNYLNENYIFDPDGLENNSEETFIENINGEPFLWSEIISQYKGQILYVELWASWCAPCRAEIPHSIEFINHNEKRDLSFIFLSVDKNRANWKNAINSHSMEKFNNFIIISKNSGLLKELQLEGIPRYFIIDRNSKIIEKNAPNPSSPNLQSLLESLL